MKIDMSADEIFRMREICLIASVDEKGGMVDFGRPRASIKRKIEAAEVATSQLNSPTTCTLPFSFHSPPLPSFQSLVCHNISLNIPIS